MEEYEHLKPGVRESLPEVDQISDQDLRERVVAAWAMALSETEFTTIDEIRPSGNPDSPRAKNAERKPIICAAWRASHWRWRIPWRASSGRSGLTGICCWPRLCATISASLSSLVPKTGNAGAPTQRRPDSRPCAIPCTALTSRSRRGCRKRCVTRRADIRARVN